MVGLIGSIYILNVPTFCIQCMVNTGGTENLGISSHVPSRPGQKATASILAKQGFTTIEAGESTVCTRSIDISVAEEQRVGLGSHNFIVNPLCEGKFRSSY
jgi:hypothetical protein